MNLHSRANVVNAVAAWLHSDLVLRCDIRHRGRRHRQHDHVLVQDLVVAEIVGERGRVPRGWAVMNTAVPGTRVGGVAAIAATKSLAETPAPSTAPRPAVVQSSTSSSP